MAREKKPVHKVQMNVGKRNIIRQLLEEYEIESAQNIQDAFKDLLGGTIKERMESEMDEHLGYHKSERSNCNDYRNGYKTKQVNSSYGSMKVEGGVTILWDFDFHASIAAIHLLGFTAMEA